MPIEETAADAGLNHVLDSVTLRLAHAHLPAVLAAIEADEPWLSVPLEANAEAATDLAEFGDVDGLVLRVPTAELARRIDTLRDHGALLQAPWSIADELDPEIIERVEGQPSSTAVSLELRRTSQTGGGPHHPRLSLVVDDTKPATNLGAILGHVRLVDGEEVRRLGQTQTSGDPASAE